MKSVRCVLSIVVMSLSTVAFAADAQKSTADATHHAQKAEAPKSEAQKSFDKLKALAGSWQGKVTTDPPNAFPQDPDPAKNIMTVTLRVTSMGNAIMHEMTSPARPDDPITMLYLEGEQLRLTHFCDAGNRPRMVGKVSPDGKRVEFDFLDITGSTQYGHMQRAVFTLIDENHHQESWTFKLKGDKLVTGHFDLKRAKPAEVAAEPSPSSAQAR
jgi:hypothetical protein